MKRTILMTGGVFFLGAIVFIMAQASGGKKTSSPAGSIDSMQEINDNTPPLASPRIVIKKGERRLFLYDAEKLIKTYKIGLGFAPEGDKQRQGDGKTPEGEFYIFVKNPKSSFYLSLGVSYPGIDDAERGLREKIITKKQHDDIVSAIRRGKTPPQNTRLGGEIYIHGGGSQTDWTLGCVALVNEEMKEIFDLVPVGARVLIEP